MAEAQQPLDAAEIEFLLEGNEPKGRQAPTEGTISEADYVTIRGDLANISLTDIFQTLCMSQMAGTLRIKSAIATKQVLFTDGRVQMVDDQQVRSVQIGTRLRQAGLISEEDLNQALARQRREGGRLGDLLVDKGLVGQEQMEEVLQSHEQEEIYALFTWKRATFEFFKGEVPPEGAHCSDSFDVSGILLEVARRQDEWALIQAKIGDLDEVLVREEEAAPAKLEAVAARVLPLIDGSRSVREVASSCLIPLFECAKTVSVFLEKGLLRKATLAELATLVERQAREGRPREAVSTLALLREEREVASGEDARQVAAACLAAHDPRGAAQVMVDMALRLIEEAPGLALELLGEACGMDPGNADARLTRRRLLKPEESLPEIRKLTMELCDIFCEAGKLDLALQEAQHLKDAGGLDPAVLARLARVNHKAGNREEAEEALNQLAGIFRDQGKTGQLIAVLDQITKLNPARRDAARELREIRTSKTSKKRKRLITVGSIAALGLAVALGGTVLVNRMRDQTLLKQLEAIAALAEPSPEELETARRILAERPDSPAAQAARKVIEKDPERLRTAREKEQREKKIRDAFEEGQRLRNEGSFSASLEVYRGILAEISTSPPHQGILTTVRLPEIAKHLERLSQTRTEALARIEEEAESFNRWEGALSAVRGLADPTEEKQWKALHDFLGKWPFEAIARSFDPGQIALPVSRLEGLHRRATAILDRLEARYGENLLARELDPLLQGAREAEGANEFQKALALYKDVADRYQKDNELSLFIQGRVRKFSDILARLEHLAERAQAGDHSDASRILAGLVRSHPGIPFGGMVELPLRVDSVPPGARILLEGADAGITPARVRFKPSGSTQVLLALDGFREAERKIHGVGDGSLIVWLAPIPAWTRPLPGLVDTAPLLLGDDLLVSDRAGGLSRLERKDGREIWRFQSGDLSGKLSAPLAWKGKIYASSPEAGLRCLQETDSTELWRRPLGSAPVGTPLATPGGIVVATTQGRLLCFSPAEGTQLWNLDLAGEVIGPPTLGEGLLFLVLRPGLLLARDAVSGAARWSRRLPDLCLAQPVMHARQLLVACMDGSVLAFSCAMGEPLWKVKLASPCRLPVLAWEERLLVLPTAREAHVLSLQDGRSLATIPLPAAPSAPASKAGGRLLLGLENGYLLALDAQDYQARWRHVAGRALLAPVIAGDGRIYLATQDRELLAFPGDH